MKKKILRAFLVLFVLGLMVGIIAVEFIAPYAVIMPPKLEVAKEPARFPKGYLPQDFDLRAEILDIKVEDSIVLSNYLILSAQDTCLGTIIMLHGIGGCKEDYLGAAQGLAKEGYDCFIYDARAHGQSGGKYCTYGYYEKEDVRAVVTAIFKNNPSTKIGLWASSMGAAVALQALAIEPRIDFGIIESTFTELGQIVYEYQKRYCFGLGLRFVCNRVLQNASEIANFDYEEVRPIDAVKAIQQPILMNHGDQDRNINIKYGKALFEALKSEDKTFYTVKGGGHDNLFAVGGKDYYNQVLNFMQRQFEFGNKIE